MNELCSTESVSTCHIILFKKNREKKFNVMSWIINEKLQSFDLTCLVRLYGIYIVWKEKIHVQTEKELKNNNRIPTSTKYICKEQTFQRNGQRLFWDSQQFQYLIKISLFQQSDQWFMGTGCTTNIKRNLASCV